MVFLAKSTNFEKFLNKNKKTSINLESILDDTYKIPTGIGRKYKHTVTHCGVEITYVLYFTINTYDHKTKTLDFKTNLTILDKKIVDPFSSELYVVNNNSISDANGFYSKDAVDRQLAEAIQDENFELANAFKYLIDSSDVVDSGKITVNI